MFLIIFVFQLTVDAKIFFDVKENCGHIELCFVGIRVIKWKISIKSRCLKITKRNGKNKYLPIEYDSEALQEYTNFQQILFRKIYFKRLGIFFNFGLQNDASSSALVCGFVDVISKIAYSVFKTKKSETKLQTKIYPSFDSDVIKFGFKVKISLSIYDLLWCVAEAKTKKMFMGDKNQNAS